MAVQGAADWGSGTATCSNGRQLPLGLQAAAVGSRMGSDKALWWVAGVNVSLNFMQH